MSLIDKIRAARELKVEVEGKEFTIRRPTDEEAIAFRAEKPGLVEIVKRFTVGWNLQAIDIDPGGEAIPVKFDNELFAEWVADHPEVWEPLGEKILDAYKAHVAKRGEAEKN